MTQVVVAASIDNELSSKDFAGLKRLEQAGYSIQLFYYLPKVPAQYTMLPDFNEKLIGWRKHGRHMLNQLGDKLGIKESHRHFVDEILGPDEVFDEARELHANTIITHNPQELKESLFSRLLLGITHLKSHDKAAKLHVKAVEQYVGDEIGSNIAKTAVNDPYRQDVRQQNVKGFRK